MTRPWTLAESRLIAERVMEWEVTEINGRLARVDGGMVPSWPTEGAGEVLAAIQMDGWRIEHSFWTAASHTFCLRLRHPITKDAAEGNAREWPGAVMLAVEDAAICPKRAAAVDAILSRRWATRDGGWA